MNKHCRKHPAIARYSRNITRLANHLREEVHFLKNETDEYIIRIEKDRISFILKKMREYVKVIRITCERLGISEVQEIVLDAIRSAK